MPVIQGTQGIKTWSYEVLVVSDGDDSWELCEDCVTALGGDPSQSETYLSGYVDDGEYNLHPIFADSEMDRNPSCDRCGYVSFIFNPTAECMANWHEDIESYLVDVQRQHNADYLDRVAENANWLNGYTEAEERTFELYKMRRKSELLNTTY